MLSPNPIIRFFVFAFVFTALIIPPSFGVIAKAENSTKPLERNKLVKNISSTFAPISQSVPTIGETGSFSDGGNDYFGLVVAGTPNTIGGSPYNASWGTTPIVGSVAGRDHDDGNTRPFTRTATWSLTIPGGTTAVNSIDFTGTFAASDPTSPSGANWFVPNASVLFELRVNGSTVSSLNYIPATADSSALRLNGIGSPVPDTGMAINLTNPGGFGVTSVEMRVTAVSDSGNEEWWANGTLSAETSTVTAADVTISGRVLNSKEQGIPNALVSITDNNGNVSYTRTNPFGFYRFTEIEAGQSYIMGVRSRRYSFSPRVVNVGEDLTNIDFIAEETNFRRKLKKQ